MKDNTITVYYNGNALIISNVVAERFSLRNGQRIGTEKEFWEILGANAEHYILVTKEQQRIEESKN